MPLPAPRRFTLFEETSTSPVEPYQHVVITYIEDCTAVEVTRHHSRPVSMIVTNATTAVALLGFLFQGTGVAA